MAGVSVVASSRSRRSLLRAGFAGLAGLALGALGRPSRASAAAGGSLVMGASNDAGTSNTTLSTASTGTALLVNQNSTGTALRGVAGNGIAGFFTSANGSGVSGVVAAKDRYGVYGGNDSAATGIGAAIRANGKQNHGLVATTNSASAYAVKAENISASPGTAILALATDATAADVAAKEGYPAVLGIAGSDVTSVGLEGYSTSVYGRGVLGLASGASTSAVGVFGHATASGIGVSAVSEGDDGYGLLAQTTGNGIAVRARVYGTGTAVRADADAAEGMTFGVYSRVDSPDGFALYGSGRTMLTGAASLSGNLSVTGSLSKGSGTFRIDHPLDPANKYLSHSFVESPDMLNVYSGTVTLDAAGEATVTLPDWFEALNRDVRYQLTPLEQAAPDLHVKSLMRDGRFSIGGGRAGQLVCWQVTGIRKDAFAVAHPTPVEEPKPAAERGLYLHPVEHGQPASKGLDTVRDAGVRQRLDRPRRTPEETRPQG